jgi:hypothetical protein
MSPPGPDAPRPPGGTEGRDSDRPAKGIGTNGSAPMPSTVAHLDALVAAGAAGHLVISHLVDGRWRSRSFRTDQVDDAAQHARDLDDEGANVYVRTNLLARPLRHPGERGGKADTGAAVALVADLDIAGPGHHHTGDLPLPPDLDAALAVVADLPPPSLHVATGGGVHLWWTLDEPVVERPVELLESWADRLVAAGARCGLHVDRPDAARVLRVCGTHRRKVDRTTGELLCNRVTLADAGWPAHGLDVRPWRPRSYAAAELLDALPPPPTLNLHHRSTLNLHHRSKVGPADVVGLMSWAQILEPAGFEFVGQSTMNGTFVELWRRSGASSDYSVKAIPDGPAVAWSDACGLPVGAGQRLSKWRAFAHLHHGGDESAAGRHVRELSRQVAR